MELLVNRVSFFTYLDTEILSQNMLYLLVVVYYVYFQYLAHNGDCLTDDSRQHKDCDGHCSAPDIFYDMHCSL